MDFNKLAHNYMLLEKAVVFNGANFKTAETVKYPITLTDSFALVIPRFLVPLNVTQELLLSAMLVLSVSFVRVVWFFLM